MVTPSVQSLTSTLGKLIRTWWRQDRIRVGRSCGRLLSLNVGDRLLLDDNVFVVVKRWTDVPSTCAAHSDKANGPQAADGWFDESSTKTSPTRVEYLLVGYHEERENASEEKIFSEVARLIVPLADQVAIRFGCGQPLRELLPEEIVIL